MTKKVVVIDIGTGNVGAVAKMLKYVGAAPEVTSSPEVIAAAGRLVLPGIGRFDRARASLDELGLTDVLTQKAVEERVPMLGICVGMQLFADASEEGSLPGLGWIPGKVVRFSFAADRPLKIPHMGWNDVRPGPAAATVDPLTPRDGWRFYFVHSYHFVPRIPGHAAGLTSYGSDFTSMVRDRNIIGVQFHPEKSHKYGAAFLRAFVDMDGG